MYSLAMILIDRCPEKQRDCLEPVLRECLKPEPGERPPSAAVVAELLRNAKPPHHRFKAAAKWTAIAVTVGIIGLGAIMSTRTWQRRKELKAKYAPLIEKRARLLGRP